MAGESTELLNARVSVPDHVLVQPIKGQCALLNLETELYFGLDEVGTRMWHMLEASPTIGAALQQLAEIYDAPADRLEQDLMALIARLEEQGLLKLEA